MKTKNSRLALVRLMALIVTICVIIIASVGIVSGFTKVIFVVGLLSLACCASVWGIYFMLRSKES